jgi:hypothetical protein
LASPGYLLTISCGDVRLETEKGSECGGGATPEPNRLSPDTDDTTGEAELCTSELTEKSVQLEDGAVAATAGVDEAVE